MSRVIAVCLPASDAAFGERVRRVVAQDRGDLGSPHGSGQLQATLRESYPLATVVSQGGVWAGGLRRTVVLDVHRDGPPGAASLAVRWAGAVYDRSGAAAYRAAARILGEGVRAEHVVEQAFREVRRSAISERSVEAGGAAVEAAALRLANDVLSARDAAPIALMTTDAVARPDLAGTSLRRGSVRRAMSRDAVACLLSSQREALELGVLEDLKVAEIAERMQATAAVVHAHFRDALLAVGSGAPPSTALTLARWREAQRDWAQLSKGHPARPARALAVAHAWLDYQVASGAVGPETVVLITDADRRFVATTANAAQTLGRPSLVGLQIDDITAAYARPVVPELWTLFDANGSMYGDYDCDRPGQTPIRIAFHGIWGRPLPDLQVGYLQPPRSAPTGRMAST